MTRYAFQWITEQLAVGPAPLSYEALDVIRDAGISGIVNLGGEIAELSAIERESGFDVCFLPIEDGGVPEAPELERALEWLDEALYLGKKVLVHCRHGMGRTGTFVTSYLIRRGFGLKLAEKTLSTIRSVPTSYSQWRLLRKYDRATPGLKVRQPDLRSRRTMNLEPFFADYGRIVSDAEGKMPAAGVQNVCGRDHDSCCHELFEISLTEAAWLHHAAGTLLDQPGRKDLAERVRKGADEYACALSVAGQCALFSHRPLRCRLAGISSAAAEAGRIEDLLHLLSQQLFLALTGTLPDAASLSYPMPRVLSGAFVQDYFAAAMRVSRSRMFGEEKSKK